MLSSFPFSTTAVSLPATSHSHNVKSGFYLATEEQEFLTVAKAQRESDCFEGKRAGACTNAGLYDMVLM